MKTAILIIACVAAGITACVTTRQLMHRPHEQHGQLHCGVCNQGVLVHHQDGLIRCTSCGH